MNCPKCRTKLYHAMEPSRGSSITNQRSPVAHYEGMKCWNCGTWIEPEFVPVMPMPANKATVMNGRPQQEVAAEIQARYEVYVKSILQEIIEARLKETSWRVLVERYKVPQRRLRLIVGDLIAGTEHEEAVLGRQGLPRYVKGAAL